MKIQQSDREATLSQFRMGGSVLVLVDRFNADPLEALSHAGLPRPAVLPLEDQAFLHQPDRAPALLELRWDEPRHLEIFDWTLSQAERERLEPPWRPRICAWLFTDGATGLPAVRRTMSTALRCSLQPGRTSYLRYFDPRVFPRLVQRLGHVAIEQVIREWHQFDRDGSMLRIVSDVQAEDTMRSSSPLLRLFDPDRRDAVMRIEQLSLAAAAFARRGIVVLHQDNDRIDAALRDAKARGLTDDDDCIAFATRVVVDGTGFTAHPDLPDWCERARTAGIPFDAVVASAFLTTPSPAPTAHPLA